MVSAAVPGPHPPPGPQAPPLQYNDQQQAALVANAVRLEAIRDRIYISLRLGIPSPSEFAKFVYVFARGIDYALSTGDVPAMSKDIPDILRKVYELRKDPIIQSSILVLMISCKNACDKEWFQPTDRTNILTMANELSGNFCTSFGQACDDSTVLGTVLKVMPRYYPHMKFERLMTSMEAKVGYDVLMSDFFIERNLPRDKQIRLLVVQKENLEVSSCITSPPHVSFLVNGKGVVKRTNITMETGPQLPTDITKMLKYGANIIQAVGYFNANYIIAVAFVNDSTPLGAPKLDDYAQPVTLSPADSDVLEGPSRISLNCPISFRRIKTPIKGRLCKHYQCFDYDNYMEINSRKPTWRCPHCNTHSNFLDLRIDRKMTKILQETGDDVIDVLIYVDGSWEVAPAQADKSVRQTGDAIQQTGGSVETEKSANVIDLINGNDDEVPMNWTSALEDTKPLLNSPDISVADCLPDLPAHTPAQAENLYLGNGSNRGSNVALTCENLLLPSSGFSSSSSGTLESILPRNVLSPVITDAVSPSFETSISASGMQHASNTMQLQPQIGPLNVPEVRRPPIPRNPRREPVGVQALPVPQQNPGSSRRLQPNTFNCPPPGPLSSRASSTYQAPHVANQASVITPRNNGLPRTSSAAPQSHRHSTTVEMRSRVVGLAAPQIRGPRQSPAVQGQPGGANTYRSRPQLDQHQLMQNRMMMNQTALAASGQNSAAAQVRPPQQSQSLRSQAVPQASTPQAIARAPPHLQAPIAPTGVASSTPQVGNSDGLPELPVDENWRPRGRMRGSLTGDAYSKAIERYMGGQPRQ